MGDDAAVRAQATTLRTAPVPGAVPPPCLLVIFGASGDLTRRKLIPALYGLFRENLLPGAFAVAENGAVWLPTAGLKHRGVFVVTEHLALAVPAGEIVNDLHEAYRRISFPGAGFGTFISGPSKTADIEQALVIGAHGARTCTVFLVG